MHIDATLIAGGGVRSHGELPPWVALRFDRALELHAGEYLVALSAGTPHRPPPVDEGGFPILESRAGARYLLERGAPPELVLTEDCSLDTVGNAWFSLVIHAIPRRWRNLRVITSEFHMERTRRVFEWIYGLENAGGPYDFEFESAANEGVSDNVLALRRAKEAESLALMLPTINAIRTLADAHQWLFTRHGAYAASKGSRPAGESVIQSTY